MRIKVNPKTRLATVSGVPAEILSQILTQASLYNYDQMKAVKEGRLPKEITGAMAYSQSMLKWIEALEKVFPRWRAPELPLTKERRFAVVRDARRQRLRIESFLDSILGRNRR
jgi:hypothetical protein